MEFVSYLTLLEVKCDTFVLKKGSKVVLWSRKCRKIYIRRINICFDTCLLSFL